MCNSICKDCLYNQVCCESDLINTDDFILPLRDDLTYKVIDCDMYFNFGDIEE